MKNKRNKLVILIGLIMLASMSILYAMEKNKVELVLVNKDLNFEAYSFISLNELTKKVDEDKSTYENIRIFITNDDFDEFDVKEDLQAIYDNFNLDMEDANSIPLGKNVVIRYLAEKSNTSVEKTIVRTLSHHAEIRVFDVDKQELSPDTSFTIPFNGELESIFDVKAYIVKFDQLAEEVPLVFEHSINTNKDGNYTLRLVNNNYNFKKEVEVIVEKKIEVIQEKKTNVIVNKDVKQAYDIDRLDVLVNKQYHLGKDAVPSLKLIPAKYAVSDSYRAQPEAVDNFVNLVDTMKSEAGMVVLVTSAYRSYSYQAGLFGTYAKRDGEEAANKYSARAGKSEHQTGLAIDVVKPGVRMVNFGSTEESVWVANNAHRFGFIIRYPKGKESITGYQYEPWHLRYLGKDLALKVKNSGLTFDEYWIQNLQ